MQNGKKWEEIKLLWKLVAQEFTESWQRERNRGGIKLFIFIFIVGTLVLAPTIGIIDATRGGSFWQGFTEVFAFVVVYALSPLLIILPFLMGIIFGRSFTILRGHMNLDELLYREQASKIKNNVSLFELLVAGDLIGGIIGTFFFVITACLEFFALTYLPIIGPLIKKMFL